MSEPNTFDFPAPDFSDVQFPTPDEIEAELDSIGVDPKAIDAELDAIGFDPKAIEAEIDRDFDLPVDVDATH